MSFLLKRTVLNPILVISGILTLVSGLFLFFHIKSHLIVPTHEIAGLVFSVVCLLHLLLNWKPLLHSVKGRLPGWAMLVLLILSTVVMGYSGFMFDPGQERGRGGHDGKRLGAAQEFVAPAVEDASIISTVIATK